MHRGRHLLSEEASLAYDQARARVARFIRAEPRSIVFVRGATEAINVVARGLQLHKDDVVLRQAYWEADISEYWLVDARKEPLRFEILQHTSKGYSARRKKDGWAKSEVFGKSFRLIQSKNTLGHPEFSLQVR